MKTLRVCIGSNDGVKIASTHMGDTERFFIFDISDGRESGFVEERKNMAVDLNHASNDKMKIITEILDDADIFVAARNSPNFRKIAAGTKHQPIVVQTRSITEALALIQQSFQQIHDMVIQRRKGTRDTFIPVL